MAQEPEQEQPQQKPRYLTGDSAAINEFIDKFDVFLFDCDGVLWEGTRPIPGAIEVLHYLRKQGMRLAVSRARALSMPLDKGRRWYS